jgi:hypothetical protein
MRGRVVEALRALNAVPVENPVLPGTPDVNFVEGWLELKWLRAWPKSEGTVVRVEHFTPQQRIFHLRRRMAGGRSDVLIQCRREWILLDGSVAIFVIGQATRQQLHDAAVRSWSNGLDRKELVECVSRPANVFSLSGADSERLRQLLRRGTASANTDTSDGRQE